MLAILDGRNVNAIDIESSGARVRFHTAACIRFPGTRPQRRPAFHVYEPMPSNAWPEIMTALRNDGARSS